MLLRGITYGNGQFVAAGNDCLGSDCSGAVLTSADGLTWVRRPSGPAVALFAIAYGSGRFVVVGFNGATFTSVDGIKWHQGMSVNVGAGPFGNIAYGHGRFVHVDFIGGVAISTDGIAWSQHAGLEWNSGIAYGNGRFVLVGSGYFQPYYGPGEIQSSTDGVNWVRRPAWQQRPLHAVAYGNGHFVAVGQYGTILQSGRIIGLSITSNAATGLLSLSIEGPSRIIFTIQTSNDLISWRDVTRISNAQFSKMVLNGLPIASERQFYRAFWQ